MESKTKEMGNGSEKDDGGEEMERLKRMMEERNDWTLSRKKKLRKQREGEHE